MEQSFELNMVARARGIIRAYENDDKEKAEQMWLEMDEELEEKRGMLSAPLLDLVLQLEFLLEEDPPTVDLGDVQRALFIAETAVSAAKGR